MPKRIAILGSTGSIGTSALDVIAKHSDRLCASALCARTRVEELIAQCDRFKPAAVGIADESALPKLRECVAGQIYAGTNGLAEMVCRDDVDIVLAAIVGALLWYFRIKRAPAAAPARP